MGIEKGQKSCFQCNCITYKMITDGTYKNLVPSEL